MNSVLLKRLSQPAIAIPSSMALHAGASAYGNVLNENQLEKSDGRMILESIMAALGAGIGVTGAHKLNKSLQAGTLKPTRVAVQRALPRQARTPIMQVAPNLASLGLSGVGAGIAGNALAPFLAGNLNAIGVPSMSGRQQDFYEEDQPGAPIDEEVLRKLLVGILKEQNG